ncbi:uncharacterized protein LOC134787049 [Penaeus indicus]|uniref:uncharacterized protein LOC134787049 n=1 Tax=Penaeus indicus TaxID=29960 RepID=UPI00300CCE15
MSYIGHSTAGTSSVTHTGNTTPHIILINSHGLNNSKKIKIHTYTIYQTNHTGERNDGVALAIKNNINHKIYNNFNSELIAVEINTPHGPIIIATVYLPPRRPYIPDQDIFQLLRHRKPTYILGDWNAQHPTFGYNHTNAVGRGLVSRILDGTLTHIGPHFPTFINNRTATTPDIVLTNRYAHLNIHLSQGEITTSDHLPIIATLSTNPIMVPTLPRENYRNADWDSFKEALSHTNTPDLQGCPTSDIDNSVESWYSDINRARQRHIPKTTHRTIPQHKQNDTLRSLTTQYTNIQNLAQTRGWDRELRTRYKQIQAQLHNVNKELHAETWTRLANELCQNHKDPKQFWMAYKELMGTNKQHCSFIYNEQNEKIYTQDMETIHRSHRTISGPVQESNPLPHPQTNKSVHYVTNYRPISLLEIPGKILERIITNRLNTHLEANNIHNPRQYGFRAHRGTESAIALAYEEVALGLANKKQTNIILRDISKAFDKVWHDRLKLKIINLQLPHNFTRLLCNFLNNRTANIRLENHLGPPIPLRSGVSQGSILSPTLFILYTADLPLPAPFSNHISYADDITQIITHPSKSKHIMKRATETAITNINNFERKWKIQTNTQKFTIIPVARLNAPNIQIQDTKIPYGNSGKILGLSFNRWGIPPHIKQRITQATATLAKLHRFSQCTTQKLNYIKQL